jgi:hypothetical protein
MFSVLHCFFLSTCNRAVLFFLPFRICSTKSKNSLEEFLMSSWPAILPAKLEWGSFCLFVCLFFFNCFFFFFYFFFFFCKFWLTCPNALTAYATQWLTQCFIYQWNKDTLGTCQKCPYFRSVLISECELLCTFGRSETLPTKKWRCLVSRHVLKISDVVPL